MKEWINRFKKKLKTLLPVESTYKRILSNSFSFPEEITVCEHAKSLIRKILHSWTRMVASQLEEYTLLTIPNLIFTWITILTLPHLIFTSITILYFTLPHLIFTWITILNLPLVIFTLIAILPLPHLILTWWRSGEA